MMAMIRKSFEKTTNSIKGWKGFIPTSKWEKEVLNDPNIKYRMEILNEEDIKKGDESLLAISVLAYNCQDGSVPSYEDGILVGFEDEDENELGICCPDNFSIVCIAAAMQKKGGELRKLKKLAEKQKEPWFLLEYNSIMKYYRKEMNK